MPKPIRVSDRDGAPESERQPRTINASGASLETVPKRLRRVFSAADKLRIVKYLASAAHDQVVGKADGDVVGEDEVAFYDDAFQRRNVGSDAPLRG